MAAKPFGTSANFKPAEGEREPGNFIMVRDEGSPE
jgi:hypothetical protein